MKKYCLIMFFIMIYGSLFIFKCTKKPETIATAGKLKVTSYEILKVLANKYPDQYDFKNIELDKKREILDDLIFKKLKVNEALELGFDQDDRFRKTNEEKFKSLLFFRYYEEFIVNQLVSEDEVEKMKEKRNVELRASHILIGFSEASKRYDRSKEEAKILAQFITNEAKSGEDFNDLVKKYSDDPNTVDKNGDLGYFRWGKMAEPFQEKAWEMKVGEISEPVETQFGFHIIRLDDRREIPSFGSDREIYYQAKRELFYQQRSEVGKITDSVYAAIRNKHSFQLKTEEIKNLAELITNKQIENKKITENSFSDEEKMITLAEWDGGKMTLDSLLQKLGYHGDRIIADFRNSSTLQDYITRYANNEIIIQDALEHGFDKDCYVVDELKKNRELRLVQLYDEKELSKKIDNPEDAEIENYYQNNPEEFKSEDGKIQPLEKVKAKIRNKLRRAKSDANIAEHKKMLFEKYPVKINENALAEL